MRHQITGVILNPNASAFRLYSRRPERCRMGENHTQYRVIRTICGAAVSPPSIGGVPPEGWGGGSNKPDYTPSNFAPPSLKLRRASKASSDKPSRFAVHLPYIRGGWAAPLSSPTILYDPIFRGFYEAYLTYAE